MNVMWKLTIEDDEGSQTALQLASAEYHIGRDEGNNVRLTDRNVSRRHATLKRNGDETWHLVDHESYNGSFVNGQRVAGSSSLGHADLIQLGDYRIFLTNEERALAPPSASGKPASSSVPPTPEYPDRLVVLVGPEPGYECRLDRGVVTIGRSEECTFAINHPSVSRVHAVVHPVAPGRFEILDKDSANGLRINGVDMRRKILEGGDVIEFGDVQMRYFEQGQAPRPGGSDISQRLRALSMPAGPALVHPSEVTAEPATRSRFGRWGAIALAVLAAGVGVAALQSRPKTNGGQGTPLTAMPVPDDANNALVERARTLVRTEPGEALRTLASMPDGPRRRAADVTDLAGQAADTILRGAAGEAEQARRHPMLAPLLGNPLVDAERQRQAKDLLKPLNAVVPPTPTTSSIETPAPRPSGGKERPTPGVTGGRDRVAAPDEGAVEPVGEPARPATARVREREGRDREGATTAKPPVRPREREGPEAVDTSQAIQEGGEAATRRSIENRLQSGKVTADELRMLKAICQHQGDSACKERAQEAMRKLSE